MMKNGWFWDPLYDLRRYMKKLMWIGRMIVTYARQVTSIRILRIERSRESSINKLKSTLEIKTSVLGRTSHLKDNDYDVVKVR